MLSDRENGLSGVRRVRPFYGCVGLYRKIIDPHKRVTAKRVKKKIISFEPLTDSALVPVGLHALV